MPHMKKRIIALALSALMCIAPGIVHAEAVPEAINIGHGIEIPLPEAQDIVLTHKEYAAPSTEFFSARIGGAMVPLYRIDFGKPENGILLGTLHTEDGDLTVTYQMIDLPEQSLSKMDEEGLDAYYGMMENINLVMDAILADPRFTEAGAAQANETPAPAGVKPPDGAVKAVETQKVELAHWTVTLPAGMRWEESAEKDSYGAIFYGRIGGEDIPLYAVNIGGSASADAWGEVKLNGKKLPVLVDINPLDSYTHWSDQDFEQAYMMMDSVNDVLQVILEA